MLVAGLNATLLEKENELSKINKDLKTLEPYKVCKCEVSGSSTVYVAGHVVPPQLIANHKG